MHTSGHALERLNHLIPFAPVERYLTTNHYIWIYLVPTFYLPITQLQQCYEKAALDNVKQVKIYPSSLPNVFLWKTSNAWNLIFGTEEKISLHASHVVDNLHALQVDY